MMTQDEDLEQGKERCESSNTGRQETSGNQTGILPPDPYPFQVAAVQGTDMTDSAAKKSNDNDPEIAKRSLGEFWSKKTGSPQNSVVTPVLPGAYPSEQASRGTTSSEPGKDTQPSRTDRRSNSPTPGAHHESTTSSRESRKAQRSRTRSPVRLAAGWADEANDHLPSTATTFSRESRSNSDDFANSASGGSTQLSSQSPSRETVETTPSNFESTDDPATENAYLELKAEKVDDNYLEEVERLREENQAIKAEQEQQRQQQQREQEQQQDEDMAVVVAENVTEPNYTRQMSICLVCLIIVVVASVMGTMAYENSLDSRCTDLPSKEVLLSDVGDFHEEAFAWISQNDTWLPSGNCDNAVNLFLERYALSVLYFDTQGPNWFTNNNNWLQPVSVCDWQQIVCDDARHVIEVDSVNKNFVGTIPTEIGLLTALTRINFDLNELTGTIPSEIGKWTRLGGFYFAKNHLSGPIPSEAGRMTALTRLNVIENDLSGTLPTEIGMWTAATRLLFHDCNFWGKLPSEIGNVHLLTRLDFFNNALSGQLPSEIGSLTNMLHANVFNNSFSGTLPSEFGLLNKMKTLDLRNNTLEGSLPTELGRITTLETFMAVGNQFSGSIPPLPYTMEMCELAPLGETGNCFSNLANQQNCEVEGNCPRFDPEVVLADYAPLNEQAVGWLKNDTWSPPLWATDRFTYYLQRYAVASLWFETGGDKWFNEGNWMSSLSVCDWHRILCNATEHVVFVDLVESNLGGSIPTELALLTTLTRLNLDNNRLTGTLPSELALLSDVSGMFIYGNELSGTIPSEWGNLTALSRLNLANNGGLSGNVPTEIGMWTSCTRIMLFGNRLSGTIPSLPSLSLLTKLELNDNAFTGTLPELDGLSSLKGFDVRNNRLTGDIPSLPLNLTNCQLASFDETGNCFCTDPNDATGCNIEGNCPEGVNSTTVCDIGGDGAELNNTDGYAVGVNCTMGMNTTVGDGLNNTDGYAVGVNCTTGMNTTMGDGLNNTDGCTLGVNCTTGMNTTVGDGLNNTDGCILGVDCTTGINTTMEDGLNNTDGCTLGVHCTTGMNATMEDGLNNTDRCTLGVNCTTGINTTMEDGL